MGEIVFALHGGGTTSANAYEEMGSLLVNSGVNMTNCYKQCERFFERYKSIKMKVLIGYWMKARYLGHVSSAEKSYRKGEAVLFELIDQQWMLKYSDGDEEVIQLGRPTYSDLIRCRHQGLCATEIPELVDFLDLDKIGDIELTDGILKKKKKGSVDFNNGNHQSSKLRPSKNKELKYLATSNPRLDSLKPLLKNIKRPSALLLRGCELALQADFPFEKFATLTALEISGLTHLPSFLESTISRMSLLQSINLSDLPMKTLAIDFTELRRLRQLILKGSFGIALSSLQIIAQLPELKCLNLSYLLIDELPDDFFSQLTDLRRVIISRCSKLRSLPSIKSLKKLEALDLSFSALEQFATVGLRNSQLQMLDLSNTLMRRIPSLQETPNLTHLFFRGAKVTVLSSLKPMSTLEVLDLSGAPYVKQANQIRGNENLVVLDLSRTRISSVDFLSNFIHLRDLKLQECTELEQLPAMDKLTKLEVLDISGCKSLVELPEDLSNLKSLKELHLSGCTCLKELRKGLFDQMSSLVKLDLSGTKLNNLPSFSNLTSLRKLSLRGLELASLQSFASLSSLVELNLNGLKINSSHEFIFNSVHLQNLQFLDLSYTSVETLSDLSLLINLKELLLANCQQLKLVSGLQTLTGLETLDLSLPKDFTISNFQTETESEAQKVQLLSAPSNLRKLVLENRPGVLPLFPLPSLGNLEYLDIRGTGEIDFVRDHSSQMEKLEIVLGWDSDTRGGHVQRRSSKADEFHVVSTFYQSGFDRFKTEFTKLNGLISNIKMKVEAASPDSIAQASIKNQVFTRHFGSMLADLKYLRGQVDLLEGSHNSKSSEELLHELMDAAAHLSADDFTLDSANLNVLIRLVLKLKLLLPTKQLDELEAFETTKENKLRFTRSKDKEEVVIHTVEDPEGTAHLARSYESLTTIERDCLLCFAVFPCSKGTRLLIKNRMLIHWWEGEKFFDRLLEKNARDAEMPDKSKTAGQIGKEILESLEKKGFIEKVVNKGRDSGSCSMQPAVHSFIAARAKEEDFFDFGQEKGKLTLHSSRSTRACLLKSQDNFPSSCKLWANNTSSSKGGERFNNIRALLNVNEPILNIRAEWFSKMKDLFVLHLGGWGFQDGDQIEVTDENFFEFLSSMNQLRLLSLQGFSAIKKLPNSICKLINLRILNLRDCGYLEELPADIGSLKNLTHLDLTHCRLLSKLPKGVRSLVKIEVLKGFVINYQGGGQRDAKACVLRDLLRLENLSKLSILVNTDKFPSGADLQVFKEMKTLCNLKITWERSYGEYEEPQDAASQIGARNSIWKRLKCWEQQTRHNDTEESLRCNHLTHLKKLVLCCFPLKPAPFWLSPSELKNLQKLYIVGGSLAYLTGTKENTWDVKILRLKYLRHLKILWPELGERFPNMTYLENHQCDKLMRFPCDDEGVWKSGTQKNELARE